ncbi:hypothetical protein N185_16195 [Sinorhizobium sp. GW3]|nr:hypothetical protein N185_16195 [Sinorhizobium sp. GW3]
MRSKLVAIESAVSGVRDGMTIMISGFGIPGTPFMLIDELLRQRPRNLTIIKNDANESGMGIDLLLEAGMVDVLVVSHIGLNPRAIEKMNTGRLRVEFNSQGILAERIRAAGVGLSAVLTDIGLGTALAEGKQCVELDNRTLLVEPALHADFAFIHAHQADCFGNLRYAATARNFAPLMAMAAKTTVVEVEEVVPLGMIAADLIHTPGPFVQQVVALPKLSEAYNVFNRA